jgi:hypothetical protein
MRVIGDLLGPTKRLFDMTQALWTQKGESLSHKNASKEFGLEESEIIEAIRAGKLQYKINYVHGNPYYKLLRKEVKALAIELRGESHYKKQEIEYQISKITKEINSCARRLKVFEREKEALIQKLTHLENDKINGQQKQ